MKKYMNGGVSVRSEREGGGIEGDGGRKEVKKYMNGEEVVWNCVGVSVRRESVGLWMGGWVTGEEGRV